MTMTYIKFIDNKRYMHINKHVEEMQLLLTMHNNHIHGNSIDVCSRLCE